jgi:hypothetical protein
MSRARDVADTQDNLGGAVPPFVAGKNVVINGGFDIWQRGTSFTITAGNTTTYTADRWTLYFNGNGTVTQDTTLVNPGNRYGLRVTATATTVSNVIYQVIETLNTLPMAGQTVTLSAYAAGTPGKAPLLGLDYSTIVDDVFIGTYTGLNPVAFTSISTSSTFQKMSYTFTIPSNAKTLRVVLQSAAMVNTEFITWSDAQLEIGRVATPFARAGGTIQGELAACQRYYYKRGGGPLDGAYTPLANGSASLPTQGEFYFQFPVIMRVSPTSVDYSTLAVWDGITLTAINAAPTIPAGGTGVNGVRVYGPVASGLTQYRPYILLTNNSTSGYMAFSAEL